MSKVLTRVKAPVECMASTGWKLHRKLLGASQEVPVISRRQQPQREAAASNIGANRKPCMHR